MIGVQNRSGQNQDQKSHFQKGKFMNSKCTVRLRQRPAYELLVLSNHKSALLFNISSKSCSSESKVIILSGPLEQ